MEYQIYKWINRWHCYKRILAKIHSLCRKEIEINLYLHQISQNHYQGRHLVLCQVSVRKIVMILIILKYILHSRISHQNLHYNFLINEYSKNSLINTYMFSIILTQLLIIILILIQIIYIINKNKHTNKYLHHNNHNNKCKVQ
jgi:hypothetical protein